MKSLARSELQNLGPEKLPPMVAEVWVHQTQAGTHEAFPPSLLSDPGTGASVWAPLGPEPQEMSNCHLLHPHIHDCLIRGQQLPSTQPPSQQDPRATGLGKAAKGHILVLRL